MHQSSVRKANAAAAKRVSKGAARLVKGGPAAQDAKDAAAWGTSRSSSTFPLPPSTAKAPMTDNHSFTSAPNSIGGFAPPSPISPPWMRPQASDPASWNNNTHTPGGFMSFFNNRMKVLEMQQKLSSEKLESTRIAHLAAVANKEAKMIEGYTSLLSRDTSTMSNEEKVEHVAALKCFRKTLFPESI